MEKRTVEECFYQIRNGANIKQGVADGGFPITRIETLANDKFRRDRMGYAGITDIGKYESYVLEDGDLLMSHINSVQYLGRTVLYQKQGNETIIHGMNLLGLKANRDIINPAYARYYFYSPMFREQIRKITKKSVNQASFAVTDLKKLTILLPSLNEQAQIVEVLDKINKLIELRQGELRKLDELIKSRFVELFGNIDECENKLELQDICLKITDGSHNPPAGVEKSQNYMISSQNIHDNIIDYKDVRYLSDSDFENENKRTAIMPGDVLLTIVGAIGRSAVVKDDLNITCQRSVCVIHPNGDKVNSIYLKYMLDNISDKIINEARGAAQKGIYLNQVKKLQIICPSFDLQNQFATFVEQTNKSKVVVQKALAEAQTLIESLMQKYFG